MGLIRCLLNLWITKYLQITLTIQGHTILSDNGFCVPKNIQKIYQILDQHLIFNKLWYNLEGIICLRNWEILPVHYYRDDHQLPTEHGCQQENDAKHTSNIRWGWLLDKQEQLILK